MDYVITPRVPGVRPKDPPDYDGITFVYITTVILAPWTVPAMLGNVSLAVANSQGFVAGMSIMIENAGYYQVVAATALDRLIVQNLGYSINQPPGMGIIPGLITTTSLPGAPGPAGPPGTQGTVGPPGTQGPPGPPLQVKGAVAGVGNLPPSGNTVGDLYVVTSNGHAYAWNGTAWIDMGPFLGPPGASGLPAHTFSNAGFTVPAIGSSVTVPVTDSSWVALGEIIYVQDAGGPGVAGPMQVTAKTPTSLTLLNIATSSGAGPAGPAGPTGAAGAPGQSAYTLSTSGFTIPAVGFSVTVPVVNTSWVALNEVLWIQDAGGPGVAGAMRVTAISPTSLTLTNF